MKDWTVRAHIIGAFSSVIVIMVALGGLTYLQLRNIRADATAIETDVLPGVLVSAHTSIIAHDLLATVVTQFTSDDPVAQRRAADTVEQLLSATTRYDEAYRRTITAEQDRVAFDRMRSRRERFVAAYRTATADSSFSKVAVNASLRPLVQEYIAASDSLFETTRHEGDRAARDIIESVTTSLSTLVPALILAALVAMACAWLLLRIIQTALSRLMTVTSVMSAGDFRQRVEIARRDELGLLGEGINRMADDLAGLIGQVQQSGVQVNSSATEIAATSKQQQATATEIAATTAEVGATASRISATSKELVHTMEEVGEVASHTASLAQSGQGGLQRMESTMRQIGDAAALINSRLALLSEKASNIGMVVTTIAKVADQTNLLSLNAAIEAEKAGEHGRGFAVVAREIRRLADQTATATFDIEQLVKEIQSAVSAGVMGMDKFSEEVRRGGEVIGQVTTELSDIIGQVQTLTPSFETVHQGVQSQSISAEQISDALAQLSMAAQQTADSLRQSNMAITQLNDAARGLQSGVSRFTLAA